MHQVLWQLVLYMQYIRYICSWYIIIYYTIYISIYIVPYIILCTYNKWFKSIPNIFIVYNIYIHALYHNNNIYNLYISIILIRFYIIHTNKRFSNSYILWSSWKYFIYYTSNTTTCIRLLVYKETLRITILCFRQNRLFI